MMVNRIFDDDCRDFFGRSRSTCTGSSLLRSRCLVSYMYTNNSEASGAAQNITMSKKVLVVIGDLN